ncbi:MAG: aromatic ring-hydroxylating dioxygenase subunit alpha [Verrucomicrobia bacterium]|nr:aromatic ring-hydroxylating dioxygenase subunit alpha [Verrucomicrobiota bacterium]MBI3867341.1 aromatic ring-hydroxylating dioxygenase subunit alpha [Verrucomicrobiota bacterium]
MNRGLNASLPSMTRQWVASQPAGHSLSQPFYREPEVYQADLDLVWRQGWLFAAHACEVSKAGDYVTLAVGADSIIVARDAAGALHAFHNVCRHRGSLICDQDCGHSRKLVCPYHSWTYGLDGSLQHAPAMPESLDKSQYSLRPVALREASGLVFICLSERPPDFEAAGETFDAVAKPQGLARARVAKRVDYLVKANWKLVWENNRECFHCNANHPQYIKANFDHYNADDTSPRVRELMDAAVRRSEAKWKASGFTVSHKQTGMTTFPDAERNIWYAANRTALVDGYVSETMDGAQVAPLMGDYPDPDVGTLRMRTLPNFWNHSSCDHSVSTRLLPAGPELTAIRVWWLVAAHAVEGRDYQLEKLMPFWQLTSEQDWEICERQQRGVNSSAYRPGPYSPFKEYNVDAFVRWYLNQLKASQP